MRFILENMPRGGYDIHDALRKHTGPISSVCRIAVGVGLVYVVNVRE